MIELRAAGARRFVGDTLCNERVSSGVVAFNASALPANDSKQGLANACERHPANGKAFSESETRSAGVAGMMRRSSLPPHAQSQMDLFRHHT